LDIALASHPGSRIIRIQIIIPITTTTQHVLPTTTTTITAMKEAFSGTRPSRGTTPHHDRNPAAAG